MSKIEISFIICTRNRLPFLRLTLSNLIDNIQANEEIVVVDGNSTDGTQDYLQELFNNGQINYYISEVDRNQAHGWNKAMLLAKGIIIKKIIDDDIFDYKSIRKCARYMIDNPKIDVMISNDLSATLSNYKEIQKHSRLFHFDQWRTGLKPSFTFGDVHMLIRRTALSFIGLYNTGYIMIDWEYSLHISYLQANITYYTGFNALSVYHNQSISALKNKKNITDQGNRASIFYEYAGDGAEISLWSKIKIGIGKFFDKQKKNKIDKYTATDIKQIAAIYQYLQSQLEMQNLGPDFRFIQKDD